MKKALTLLFLYGIILTASARPSGPMCVLERTDSLSKITFNRISFSIREAIYADTINSYNQFNGLLLLNYKTGTIRVYFDKVHDFDWLSKLDWEINWAKSPGKNNNCNITLIEQDSTLISGFNSRYSYTSCCRFQRKEIRIWDEKEKILYTISMEDAPDRPLQKIFIDFKDIIRSIKFL